MVFISFPIYSNYAFTAIELLSLYLHFIVLCLLKRITGEHSADVAAPKTCHDAARKCLVSRCHLIKTIQILGGGKKKTPNAFMVIALERRIRCCFSTGLQWENRFALPVA